MSTRALIQLLGALMMVFTLAFATGCGGGGDDGDGGQLSAREEQRVKEWFASVTAIGESLDQTGDPFSADEDARDEMISQMRRFADLTPPRLSDNAANQAFQDLHGGMCMVIEPMIELMENMPSPDEGPQAMAAAMQEMMGMQATMQQTMQQAEAQVRSAAQTIQAMIEVDFADDPEGLAQLREAIQDLDM
jgi:hypothetical protein